jgi:hypothetical protein
MEPPKRISLSFSLAEQCFDVTRSIGLLNLSLGMLDSLVRHPQVDQVTLFSNSTFRQLDLPPNVTVLQCEAANGRGLKRIWWDQFGAYRAARQAGHGWLMMPKGFVSFLRPPPVRLAAYVPDTMQDYYDRTYAHLPCSLAARMEGIYLRRSLRAALQYARVIFTCSEFTSSELANLARRWGLTPPPLVAIGTGFAPSLLRSDGKDLSLVVLASPYQHKRTDLALDYLARWQKESGFAGRIDWVGSLPSGCSLPVFPGWKLHSRVPEAEYRDLIARARALVYFTEYEGFGMPPVEAIIAGTCAVYSDIPASREVLSGCGAPFLNQDYPGFVQALNDALATPETRIQEWTATLLDRHNWKKGGDKIVHALRKHNGGVEITGLAGE